jgi:biopolymer transport protein ExbB
MLLILFLVAMWAPAAVAQDDLSSADAGASGAAGKLFDHFVSKGGPITWFILIPLSVATLALVIEHSVSIRRATLLPDPLTRTIAEHLKNRQYVDAVKLATEDGSMLGYVVHTALREASHGFAAMERAIEEAVEERAARLYRKIEYLNIIGSISPMIGLFGTVYGLIRVFASISAAGGIPEPAVMADDISIALVTTFWGLLVAIPALSVFALFRNRIELLSAECALSCERLLETLKPEPLPDAAAGPEPCPPPSAAPAPLG